MGKVNKPHLLVIGGTGFIGCHLIKAAQTKGWKISSASLTIPSEKNRINKVNYYKVDITNISSIKRKLNKSFDYVVNLGGYINHASFSKRGQKIILEHFISVQNLIKVLSRKKIHSNWLKP